MFPHQRLTTIAFYSSFSPAPSYSFRTVGHVSYSPVSGGSVQRSNLAHCCPLRRGFAAMSSLNGRPPELATPFDVYRFLYGCWELSKDINYVVGGAAGTWTGTATFTPPVCRIGEDHPSDDKPNFDTNGHLRYEEKGVFVLDGRDSGFEAGQRLLYDCSVHPVSVHFVDDPSKPDVLRFFHHLDFQLLGEDLKEEVEGEMGGKPITLDTNFPTEGRPTAKFEHLCVRDMYRGEVEVVGPHEFRTRWCVTGPNKDGRIDATYRRRLAKKD
ncbi:unnamed protein product [Choristocarpus tenellus]